MTVRIPVFARGASTTPVLSVFLIVVIAGLSFLGLATTALVADGGSATLERSVAAVPDLTRWPSATMPGLPAFSAVGTPGAGVWGPPLDALERVRDSQPEPLQSLLGTPRLAMTLDPLPSRDEDQSRTTPVPQNKVSLVSAPGLFDRVDLVSGRLPERTGPPDGIEIVLTETVAEQLAWEVGTERAWDDTVLMLTGLVAPTETDSPDWAFIDGSVRSVVEVDGSGNRVLIGAGLMHVDEMVSLTDRVRDIKVTSWMPFNTAGVSPETVELTAAQLRLLPAASAMIPMYDETFFNRGLSYHSTLPQAFDAGIVRAAVMTAVVTVAAAGPIVVAFVVLALVSRLIAVRRVTTSEVLRARGASTAWLVALFAGEGVALGILGALLGIGIAALGPGWSGGWVLLIPAILAVVPAVTLPWATLSDAERGDRGDLGEPGMHVWGRAVLEGLTLILTVALAVIIMTRGESGGADPMLLALLVMLGVSGSILSLRVLPMLLRVAEYRGRRSASLIALLGPARARRGRVVRAAPVLGVVVGLGVAVFSVAFAATVSGGIVRSADIRVGADVRIDAAHLSATGATRVSELDGVAELAVLESGSTTEASAEGHTARTRVYAIDREALAHVQRDSQAPLPLPAALAESAGDAMPVVVSDRLLEALGVHGTAGMELEVAGVPVRVVGVAPSQVPFGTAEQWVIVDAANAAMLNDRSMGISQLFIALSPGADPEEVGAAAVAALGDEASFITPARAAADYTEDPGYGVVQGALLAASVVVAVLLTVAIIATLVLGATSRSRMLAILRTLGYPRRAAGRLVGWEVMPALLIALPFGVGAGVAMARLVIPQLDLRGFVGGVAQPPVALGGPWLPLVVAVFCLVVAGAIFVAAVLASRLGSAVAIRADEERMQ